ncbi:hypothetical protein [Streptomyces malaysiensis]|uniref:Uncharacterized protein n=1 Tax=Streptomyces malaysiensis subsp. samsunensis TaxID=459658 RepID=A0A9X2RXF9_STRMQ|nr:hypothetical protein [Streptomyces samsunensis]MCQ8831794.1 hypothetical protein [Streptomyces samsunensis]
MTTYQPGNYKISVTATMPAKVARQMYRPERFQYSGDTATVTFGPMPIRAVKKETDKSLAANFLRFCMAEQPKAKYTIQSINITPDVS